MSAKIVANRAELYVSASKEMKTSPTQFKFVDTSRDISLISHNWTPCYRNREYFFGLYFFLLNIYIYFF